MNLAERDQKIFQMKAELENRKKMLCSKRKVLKQTVRENGVLNQVLADYSNYNQDIANQKKEQIDLLKSLHEYIGNVSHHNIHTNSTLMKESKTDQREILKEINHLKHELAQLTD
jgi:hypothetical protein|tara:strand:+ start:783 stop:1127 length:345 start_codon:yes stop_codon:yes gene_type:complete